MNKLNFVVFSHRTRKQALEYHGSAQVVSDIWIRHCAKDGKLLDLGDHLLYRPFLRTLLPLPGFEKYLLCSSQLRDKERELAAELCMLLGGKFSKDLVTQVTHLILKVAEGDKYRGALKLGTVAIVSSDWLIACACKNMVMPVDEYRVGGGPSQKRSRAALGVEMPERNDMPHSAGNLHGTPTITECGPSLPEVVEGQRAASRGKHASSGTSELVTKEASAGMKGTIVGSTDGHDQSAVTPSKPSANHNHDPVSTGKKKGGRSRQPQHGGSGAEATEGRLIQGPSQELYNVDPWDSAAAPWAPLTAKPQQGKTFSESMIASALARDGTAGAHQRSQCNSAQQHAVHSTVASDQVENTFASPRRSVEDCAQPVAGGESLKANGGESNKDSGESEAWAAVEGLLEKAVEAMQASNKQTREAAGDAALLSPKRRHIQINQEDSESHLEFKRPKHNWHRPEAAILDRTRSSAGALGPSTSAHIHSNTQEHFEETQVESQVAYEDDLPGRQEILDKVRIRSLTVSTTRGPEESLKDSSKERLCRIADGNR